MTSNSIPAEIRKLVIERASGRCEYCLIHQYFSIYTHEVDHIIAVTSNNPELQIEAYIVLDVLIGHAVRLAWLENHPERGDRYDEDKGSAWRSFYNTSPRDCAGYVLKAFRFLTEFEQGSAVELVQA